MNNEIINHRININLIILAVSGALFFVADSFNVKYELKLRNEQRQQISFTLQENATSEIISNKDEKTTFESKLNAKIQERINSYETLKGISSISRVIFLLILAVAWFYAPLNYKFLILFLFFIYTAGMHFIDFEQLSIMNVYEQTTKISKYVLVRIFPAILFGLLFLASVLYKPISRKKFLET